MPVPKRPKLPRTDAEYEEMGLVPPEHIVHKGSESVKPDNHRHTWENKPVGSAFIHCTAGSHGFRFDHLNYRFAGTDDKGEPILKPIVLSTSTLDNKNKKSETTS